MKKAIATTTIYPPSKALLRFIEIAAQDDWHIFVAGDLKTPHQQYMALESRYPFFTYVSPNAQEFLNRKLSEAIGWNCIQRRNFAFLAAYEWGAELFATVDDDNIPMEGWGRDLMVGRKMPCGVYQVKDAAFDPISATNESHLWHRGFPIQLLKMRSSSTEEMEVETITPDVQADFWNGDPDVDAICRMQHDPKNCDFSVACFPFASNKPAPFNSQNTFFSAKVLPHYPMQVACGRSDDIWAAYHVQAQGFKVVFGKPSVVQERNAQDVMKNFEDELLNYRHNLDIVKAINAGDKDPLRKFLPERTARAFELYQKHFA